MLFGLMRNAATGMGLGALFLIALGSFGGLALAIGFGVYMLADGVIAAPLDWLLLVAILCVPLVVGLAVRRLVHLDD